jgi:transcription antitermination factor NusG
MMTMAQSNTNTGEPPYWAVAVAQPHHERLVQTLLERQDFETYWPKIKTPAKRTASLFPGYLMVRVIVRWYPVRWCPGVLRVLMNGDKPARLDDRVITEIKSRERGGFVKLPKAPSVARGQRVRVVRGMFAGHVGIYDGMSGSQRERVLLQWLTGTGNSTGSVAVVMPLGSVEAIA